MDTSPVRHRLLLVAAALLFSTGGAAIKAVTLSGWQVACFRSGIAALALLAALPETRRGWKWPLAPVAAAYAATLILFVMANRLTTSANAVFLQATAPLYLLLLGPLLLREPLRAADILYMTLVMGGMALFFVGSDAAVATAPDPGRGNLLALASGFTYALALVGLRRLARAGHGDSALAATTLGNILACLAVLPAALPVRGGGVHDLLLLLYLGVVQIGLAYVCLTRGLRHVPGVEAGTLLMIEPVTNPVWAWLVHGERPGAWALAGGAIIVLATLANTWRHAKPGR